MPRKTLNGDFPVKLGALPSNSALSSSQWSDNMSALLLTLHRTTWSSHTRIILELDPRDTWTPSITSPSWPGGGGRTAVLLEDYQIPLQTSVYPEGHRPISSTEAHRQQNVGGARFRASTSSFLRFCLENSSVNIANSTWDITFHSVQPRPRTVVCHLRQMTLLPHEDCTAWCCEG